MRSRFAIGIVTIFVSISGLAQAADAAKDKAAIKKALGDLQEFIGAWKGSGESQDGKKDIWKETLSWGWKFKGDESWLAVEFGDSKIFVKGDLKYIPEKKVYQLTVTDKDKKERVFEGELKKKVLTVTSVDAETKDKQIISMSTNNDGARLVYNYAVQAKSKGLEKKVFVVSHSKEGSSIASGNKKECVVTGGLGTMQVSFGGKTYYVCCSGCRDAFNENPKKFVDEFEKKKK